MSDLPEVKCAPFRTDLADSYEILITHSLDKYRATIRTTGRNSLQEFENSNFILVARHIKDWLHQDIYRRMQMIQENKKLVDFFSTG